MTKSKTMKLVSNSSSGIQAETPIVTRISLRDLFAGLALCGLKANHTKSGDLQTFAKVAYLQADAMLIQRDMPIKEKELTDNV